ncbi:MAG: hypothetical protein U0325_05135 [Polyangiales bacterium]
MGAGGRRWFVLGDPQAPHDRVRAALARAGLLTHDLRLRDDVGLVSLGDHFDFAGDPDDGARTLAWLASHPPSQCVILAGNHDLARVMDLARVTDEDFAAAGAASSQALAPQDFARRFPHVPTAALAARDYHHFSVAQRAQVSSLLRAGRVVLAATATLRDGGEALLTHAGVTTRELGLLGVRAGPREIAGALNEALWRAVARWREGDALDLGVLHVAGAAGEEGGGMLYHRPAFPDGADPDAWRADRPRRFDPRTLPHGVTQVCGHTGHAKCRALLGPWVAEDARAVRSGGARTLSVRGTDVRYAMGLRARAGDDATLYLLDGDLPRCDDDPPLLEVTDVAVSPARAGVGRAP